MSSRPKCISGYESPFFPPVIIVRENLRTIQCATTERLTDLTISISTTAPPPMGLLLAKQSQTPLHIICWIPVSQDFFSTLFLVREVSLKLPLSPAAFTDAICLVSSITCAYVQLFDSCAYHIASRDHRCCWLSLWLLTAFLYQ